MANLSLYYRYFVYSQEEETMKQKVMGQNASFGEVYVRGVPKRYTSIVTDPSKTKPDAIIVAKGDIRNMRYSQPQR